MRDERIDRRGRHRRRVCNGLGFIEHARIHHGNDDWRNQLQLDHLELDDRLDWKHELDRHGSVTSERSLSRFELEILGGAIERRYRKLRPALGSRPFGTTKPPDLADEVRLDAQARWTLLAFHEYGSSLVMLATTRAMIEARAPLDLCAYVSRFVTDELAHAELCALMAMDLGGATEILYDPEESTPNEELGLRPLARAAALVVRTMCIDEVLSVSQLRALWRRTQSPTAKQAIRTILSDEVGHAACGSTFTAWAAPELSSADLAEITRVAQTQIDRHRARLMATEPPRLPTHEANPLAWMATPEATRLQLDALDERVIPPLRALGLAIA